MKRNIEEICNPDSILPLNRSDFNENNPQKLTRNLLFQSNRLVSLNLQNKIMMRVRARLIDTAIRIA